MADIPLNNYYDRTDDEIAKGYERHLFRAGHVLQSAELNEMQGLAHNRLKLLGDSMFKDGDIIRDARVVVDSETGAVIAESGAIYLDGAVRGVPPAEFTVTLEGTVVIGVYLDRVVVTELDDPSLAEPAVDVQAYGEPGAARLKLEPRWGVQTLQEADNFFPIYYVDDGQLRAKDAPPVMDAVSQAIARYDVDSTGSNYVVSGMRVARLDDEDGKQIYDIEEGRARVNGHGITLGNARRLIYETAPELKLINSEPFLSETADEQVVTLARPPARDLIQVNITREKTVTMIHASVSGTPDPLPDSSVVQIIRVWQGVTEYEYGDDYVLTGQTVDWTPSGNEPAPGSSYQVTYRYITAITPTSFNGRTFKVTGAVAGSLILTTYNTMLPRIDRLCLDDAGRFVWVQGISTDYNPVRPQVPSNLITIAQVQQNWDETSRVFNDGVRTVSMREIEDLGRSMEVIVDLLARQFLESDINTREVGAKKGLFTDPFLNDDHRDAGIEQDAAIVRGELMLPIIPELMDPSSDIHEPQTCNYEIETIVSQTERTGSMKVNPYMAFDVPMATVTLSPAVDRWTETRTDWLSDVTQKFVVDNRILDRWHLTNFGAGFERYPSKTTQLTETVNVSSAQARIEYLRQIDVQFTIQGFGPGETLTSVTFDGIPVIPVQ